MLRRLASGAALVATAVMLLAGCAPPEPTETTPATSPTSSTTTTEAPLDAETVEARATAVAQEFVALVDEGFANNALPEERLRAVATTAVIEKVQAELDQFAQLGWHIEGTSVVDSTALTSWDGPDQDRGTAELAACLDTSGVVTTDGDGQPVSGNEPRQPRLFTLEYEGRQMLVADVSPVDGASGLEGCGS